MPEQNDSPCWYVLRDLKRPNAKTPAYKLLPELGFDTFTPMHWVLRQTPQGDKTREYVPFIHGLLFVRSVRSALDAVIDKSTTLQYRYVRGARQTPMTVPAVEMELFRRAVGAGQECVYYTPDEVTPDMLGRKAMIVGGTLDGMVGYLLTKRGSRKKRLVLQLRNILAASVEINSGLIRIL